MSDAAERCGKEAVKLLLENGAQPDLGDADGETPLSRALLRGDTSIIQLLRRDSQAWPVSVVRDFCSSSLSFQEREGKGQGGNDGQDTSECTMQ